jgi:hypothetical protein
MKKFFGIPLLLLLLIVLNSTICIAQTHHDPFEEKVHSVGKELQPDLRQLSECLCTTPSQKCVNALAAKGTDNIRKFVIADVLFDIDTSLAFKLHNEVWLTDTADLHLALEHAIELHRAGYYSEAIPIYKRYLAAIPQDIRSNVWLADCYLNTSDIPQALQQWKIAWTANEKKHIENAIFLIHGYKPQLQRRDSLRKSVEHGHHPAAYALVHLDFNWETDWWNNDTKDAFLEHDLQLIKKKFGEDDNDYRIINAYTQLKNAAHKYKSADSIAKVLNDNKLLLNGGAIPLDGKVTGDILNICLMNKLVDAPTFYKANGDKLLQLAKKNNDNEMLNVYTFLEEGSLGHPDTTIELLGWHQMHDERFAISYVMAIAQMSGSLKYNNQSLQLAIHDFPDCTPLYSMQVKCAQNEHMNVRPMLIALIKKEFNGLRSGPGRHSDALNAYFAALETAQ